MKNTVRDRGCCEAQIATDGEWMVIDENAWYYHVAAPLPRYDSRLQRLFDVARSWLVLALVVPFCLAFRRREAKLQYLH